MARCERRAAAQGSRARGPCVSKIGVALCAFLFPLDVALFHQDTNRLRGAVSRSARCEGLSFRTSTHLSAGFLISGANPWYATRKEGAALWITDVRPILCRFRTSASYAAAHARSF
jgi:hypothetical protein